MSLNLSLPADPAADPADRYAAHTARCEAPDVQAIARRRRAMLRLRHFSRRVAEICAARRLVPPAHDRSQRSPLFARRSNGRPDARAYGRRPALSLVEDRREPAGRRDWLGR